MSKNIALTKSTQRSLSILILGGLLGSTFFAVLSATEDAFGAKISVYENWASTLALASIILIVALSTLQKDQFWPWKLQSTIKKKFSKTQIAQRNEVLVSSFKISLFVVLAFAWLIIAYKNDIAGTVVNNVTLHMDGSFPNHLFWAVVNLVSLCFSLPIIIGSWQKEK